MKLSTKAALLSGLVFPGLGHVHLKRYLRGACLIVPSIGSISFLVTVATRRAMTIVDQMLGGSIPLDSEALTAAVSGSPGFADAPVENLALVVLGICWVIGTVDAYRLGTAAEAGARRQKNASPPGKP